VIPHLRALWSKVKKHIEAKIHYLLPAIFSGARRNLTHLFEGAGLLYVNLNVGIVDDFSLLAFFFFGCFFHFCSPF